MANGITTPVRITALASLAVLWCGLAQSNTLVPQVAGMKTANGIRLISQESANPFALEIMGRDIKPQSAERLIWLIDGKRIELGVAALPAGLQQASDLEILQAYERSEIESLKPAGWTQMGPDQQSAFPAGEKCLFFTAGNPSFERLEYAVTVNGGYLIILVASVSDPQLIRTNHEYLQRTLLSLQRGNLSRRNLTPPPDPRQFGGTLREMIELNEQLTGRSYAALVNENLVTPVDSKLDWTYRLDPVSLVEAAIFLLQTGRTFFSVVVFDGQRAHAINLDGYDETTKTVKYWDPRPRGSFLAAGSNGAGIAAAPYSNEQRRWLVKSGDLQRVLYAIVLQAGDIGGLLRNFNQKIQAAEDRRGTFLDIRQGLAAGSEPADLAVQARKLLDDRNLNGAEAALTRIQKASFQQWESTRERRWLERYAQTSYELGGVAELKFQLQKALQEYEKAYNVSRDNPRYGAAYARMLHRSHQAQAAQEIDEKIVMALTRTEPSDADRPLLLGVINELGSMYREQKRLDDAARLLEAAMGIVIPLAQKDYAKYTLQGLDMINNLAGVHRALGKAEQAEKDMLEALRIEDRLMRWRADLMEAQKASTLMNLGSLYHFMGHLGDAEKRFDESYDIYSGRPPAVFDLEGQRLFAHLLRDRAMLYVATDRKKEAEDDFLRAREIGKPLAARNLGLFGSEYASTLNQLAILYRADRLQLAAETYVDLAKVYKDLADIDEDTYLPEFARAIHNLAAVYGKEQNWDMCAKSYELVHTLYTALWKKDPDNYADMLAESSLMIVEVMIQTDGSRKRACSLLKEAKEVGRDAKNRQAVEQRRGMLACPE